MKKILLLSLSALLISSCLPRNVQVPQSPLLSTLERKAGLIAYVGVDGNIFVSDQAGGNLKQLTDDAKLPQNQSNPYLVYQFPTWSQDGNQLAFVRTGSENAKASSELLVANIDDDKVSEIYKSESEHPIYLYWSPDDANVSLLTTSVSGQSLILQNIPADGSERTIIDTGSPYYWSWAPDGNTMIIHAGGAASSIAPQHLAFLSLEAEGTDSAIIEDGLDTAPGAFQAPAWSPDGSHILLTRVNDQEQKEIILTDGSGEFEKSLGTFEINTAFAWSPDSTKVAFITGRQAMNAGTIGDLHVVNIETSVETIKEEDVYAFFWSPDSEKLAYFVPFLSNQAADGSQTETQQLVLQLNTLDVNTNESRELFKYQPTQQFANILPYFDQYHQSTTIWSPDNNNLVLSFLTGSGAPGIAVVAASGQLEPRILAEGYLAFWSWK
jgi:Tol biopolymer transport system component